MSQRHSVSGRRSAFIWLSVLIGLALIVALVVIVLFVYPNYQRQQQVEQYYQAGVAFQEAGDWDKAVEAFEKAVAINADYNDTQTRLKEVRSRQQEAQATAQAEAVQATATAQAQTMVAGATATAESLAELEDTYQKCLGAMNLERWADAKEACDQVFAIDPNYKDVQARLKEIAGELVQAPTLTPTSEPTATSTDQLVQVRSDLDWQDSEVFIRAGDKVEIKFISGEWSPCAPRTKQYGCEYQDADGIPYLPEYIPADDPDLYNLVSGCNHLALIARVGSSNPFCVKGSFSGRIERSGNLQLRTNDTKITDNDGSLTVQIKH